MLSVEAQQPAKPKPKKFDSEPKGDLYNPENLNEDERKVILTLAKHVLVKILTFLLI